MNDNDPFFSDGNQDGGTHPKFPSRPEYSLSPIRWTPSVDIYETDTEVVAIAEVPGVKGEDITVEFKDTVLTIEGEKHKLSSMRGLSFFCVERTFGRFKRSFRIIASVDKDGITANFENGILIVTLPKVQSGKGGRRQS